MFKFVLSTLSTSFILISAILVAFGWYFIRTGQRSKHIKTMIWAAVSATTFFIIYLSRTTFVGSIPFTGPESVRPVYQIFLIFHIILAAVGGAMGLITLRLGFKKQFARHKKIGPWAAGIWFATAITGVTVYLILNIIYPHGETTGLLDSIFGS